MSIVQPQPVLQTTDNPRLDDVLDAHKRSIFLGLNSAKIGVIKSFNAANQTAEVQIAQQQVTSTDPNGVETLSPYPDLLVVPVWIMGGGGCSATFPIAAGDECLIVFNDRELDNWLSNGAGLPPTTGRAHDISDGICLVGLRSFPRSLAEYSTSAAQLRSDDGITFIALNPTTQTLNLTAPGGITMNTPLVTLTGAIVAENSEGASDTFLVTGTIKATGDVQANSGSISLVNHVHTGVQSGSGNTGPAVG